MIECIIQPRNFLFLIPTITGIAMGIIFLPNFGLGLAAGAGMLVVTVVAMSIMTAAGLIEKVKERRSEYSKMLAKESLLVALFGPIQEEAIFRGAYQPLISAAIQVIVPAASAVLFGPFSIATTVSIVATGVFFGALHYLNPHKGAFQAGSDDIDWRNCTWRIGCTIWHRSRSRSAHREQYDCCHSNGLHAFLKHTRYRTTLSSKIQIYPAANISSCLLILEELPVE